MNLRSFLSSLVLAVLALAAGPLRGETSAPELLHGRMETLMKRVRDSAKEGDYPMQDYLADLEGIGRDAAGKPELAKLVADGSDSSAVDLMLKLAVDLQNLEEQARVKALDDWYARYETAIDREVFRKLVEAKADRVLRMPVSRSADWGHAGPKPYPLLSDHSGPEYRVAWETWLMAPASPGREIMRERIYEGLAVAPHDGRVVPLLVESARGETARADGISGKFSAVVRSVSLIGVFGGAPALDGMLACNRLAMEGGFALEGNKGLSRYVARVLASRDEVADDMLDPAIIQVMKDSGQEIRPQESFKPFDDHWKTYKPLIEARLKGAEGGKVAVPKEDLEVMRAALEVMPKE